MPIVLFKQNDPYIQVGQIYLTETEIEFASCRLLFITPVPITRVFAWGEGDSGGDVLRDTTSRGVCHVIAALQIIYDTAHIKRRSHIKTQPLV